MEQVILDIFVVTFPFCWFEYQYWCNKCFKFVFVGNSRVCPPCLPRQPVTPPPKPALPVVHRWKSAVLMVLSTCLPISVNSHEDLFLFCNFTRFLLHLISETAMRATRSWSAVKETANISLQQGEQAGAGWNRRESGDTRERPHLQKGEHWWWEGQALQS